MSSIKNSGITAELVASPERSQDSPAWVRQIRDEARARFLVSGLPTTAQEDWKYTSLAPVLARNYQWAGDVPPRSSVPAIAAHGLPVGNRLVLVDGRFSAAASATAELPPGAWVGSLAQALQESPPWLQESLGRRGARDTSLVDLNLAHLGEGAAIYLPRGAVCADPIHVVVLSTQNGERPRVSHPRLAVCLQAEAELTLVEEYRNLHADALYYHNGVTEICLEQGSQLRHIRVLRESGRAHHTSVVKVRQLADSRYQGHQLTLGGELVRADTDLVLTEPGARCDLKGLYMATGHMHLDHHTAVDHQVPRCLSSELYKGIVADQAHAVFNGRIVVRPNAQQTVSNQQNPNLLLSDDARIDTKPELEIYADDVKCTHGASIGRLDPLALFYLRSRGLKEADARSMLVKAFAGEITAGIGFPAFSAHLDTELLQGEASPYREER